MSNGDTIDSVNDRCDGRVNSSYKRYGSKVSRNFIERSRMHENWKHVASWIRPPFRRERYLACDIAIILNAGWTYQEYCKVGAAKLTTNGVMKFIPRQQCASIVKNPMSTGAERRREFLRALGLFPRIGEEYLHCRFDRDKILVADSADLARANPLDELGVRPTSV